MRRKSQRDAGKWQKDHEENARRDEVWIKKMARLSERWAGGN